MTMEEFCVALSKARLGQDMQGVAILWFIDRSQPGYIATPGEIAKAIKDSGLGNPNSTLLGTAMARRKYVHFFGGILKIKPVFREELNTKFGSLVETDPPAVDQDHGYLPKAVWQCDRNYINKIAEEINGCYEYQFYNGASVLIRRLVETLLIECYEKLGIEDKIKHGTNYFMLGDIIKRAVDRGELTLGRETKDALKDTKTLGDRSAHNRRYIATKADLDKSQSGIRVAVDDLLHLAGLK